MNRILRMICLSASVVLFSGLANAAGVGPDQYTTPKIMQGPMMGYTWTSAKGHGPSIDADTTNPPQNISSYIIIKTADYAEAESDGDFWICFGQHMESYGRYYRPEYKWYDEPSADKDIETGGCLKLNDLQMTHAAFGKPWAAPSIGGAKMNQPDHYYAFNLSTEDPTASMYGSFQLHTTYLEPDDIDSVRLWAATSDGLGIESIKLVYNGIVVLNEDLPTSRSGKPYFLDRPYNRQLDLTWRIARYRHDRVAKVRREWDPTPPEYIHPILEIAAQNMGHAGARKYDAFSNEWCTEFAEYVISNGTSISKYCQGDDADSLIWDENLNQDRDIGTTTLFDHGFDTCGRGHESASGGAAPDLDQLRPGYWINNNQSGHSALFVGWADDGSGNPDVGGFYWEISGNTVCKDNGEDYHGDGNVVCLNRRDSATRAIWQWGKAY